MGSTVRAIWIGVLATALLGCAGVQVGFRAPLDGLLASPPGSGRTPGPATRASSSEAVPAAAALTQPAVPTTEGEPSAARSDSTQGTPGAAATAAGTAAGTATRAPTRSGRWISAGWALESAERPPDYATTHPYWTPPSGPIPDDMQPMPGRRLVGPPIVTPRPESAAAPAAAGTDDDRNSLLSRASDGVCGPVGPPVWTALNLMAGAWLVRRRKVA